MPFFAEQVFQEVKAEGDVESVHLANWPKAGAVDTSLLEEMKSTRDVVSAILEARVKAQIKVRQPIANVQGTELSDELKQVVLDEVNAKEYVVSETVSIDTTITPELQAEGDSRDFIRAVQDLRKKSGLEAHDDIVLTVQASEEGKIIVTTFTDDIQNIVGAKEIVFADTEGVEVLAGEHSMTISIKKV
jgi:isoleucyl-tRNA synthetase